MEWEPDDSSTPTLAEALDCEYTITTGGDASWSTNTTTSYYGDDATRAGFISDNEETHTGLGSHLKY